MLSAERSIRMLNWPQFKYLMDPAIAGRAKQRVRARVENFFIEASALDPKRSARNWDYSRGAGFRALPPSVQQVSRGIETRGDTFFLAPLEIEAGAGSRRWRRLRGTRVCRIGPAIEAEPRAGYGGRKRPVFSSAPRA